MWHSGFGLHDHLLTEGGFGRVQGKQVFFVSVGESIKQGGLSDNVPLGYFIILNFVTPGLLKNIYHKKPLKSNFIRDQIWTPLSVQFLVGRSKENVAPGPLFIYSRVSSSTRLMLVKKYVLLHCLKICLHSKKEQEKYRGADTFLPSCECL